MYYSVSEDHNSMAAYLTRCDVKGFKCCVSSGMNWCWWWLICCGMTVKRMGMLKRQCEEDEDTDCEDEDSDTYR